MFLFLIPPKIDVGVYLSSTPSKDPSRRRFQIESAAFSFCLNSYNIIQLRKRSER